MSESQEYKRVLQIIEVWAEVQFSGEYEPDRNVFRQIADIAHEALNKDWREVE